MRRDSQTTKAVLFERDRELAQIDELIAESAAGDGQFLVIQGRPGLGKTSLLGEVVARAADQGMSVFRARGTELESGFAFGVVRQLFEPVVRRSGDELFAGASCR
jgi:predicted ATPase